MQHFASPLCSCSNSLSSVATVVNSHRFSLPFLHSTTIPSPPRSQIRARVNFQQLNSTLVVSPPRSTSAEEVVETSTSESEFIEIGYVSGVHGLQGEICIKHNTDFPELRFSEPGKRWLRQQFYGRQGIREVQLVSGRDHPARKCWIVKFGGIDNIDEAKQLVGSTLLVRENDRPELEEGEFYSRDLIGMRVILKETGETIGTVVNVYNSGANDLLHVMLDYCPNFPKQKSEAVEPGPLVWVPFVEAIVPDVDMNKRQMLIMPPKGLLQLNIPSGERPKKERRLLEWKERKKMQRHLIASKKKLCTMEQQHVFHGFQYGEKSQKDKLAEEIVSVNSKLLEKALCNIQMQFKGSNLVDLISGALTRKTRNLKISKECLTSIWEEKQEKYSKFQGGGLDLISKGKIATLLLLNGGKFDVRPKSDLMHSGDEENSPFTWLEELLSDDERFIKVEHRASVPVILISPNPDIEDLEKLFSSHDHFGFDSRKVWFLKEEKLPVVSSSEDDPNRHKILMKTPWEILQSPIGSGGILISLSSHGIMEKLTELGVEYVELCSSHQMCFCSNPIFLGLVNSCRGDVGIQIMKDRANSEENFHIIVSVKLLEKMIRQIDKLQFHPLLKPNSHVQKAEKEWIDIIPSSVNSYAFRCSIYSSLIAATPDEVCVMEISE